MNVVFCVVLRDGKCQEMEFDGYLTDENDLHLTGNIAGQPVNGLLRRNVCFVRWTLRLIASYVITYETTYVMKLLHMKFHA